MHSTVVVDFTDAEAADCSWCFGESRMDAEAQLLQKLYLKVGCIHGL